MAELSTLLSVINSVELNASALLSDANLQGYWRLESNWNDSSSNGYTLTPSGSPTFVSGKFGNAAHLVAASSQYASRANGSIANLDISGAQTWGMWIKPTTITDYSLPMSRSSASGANRRGFVLDNDTQNSITFELTGLTTNALVSTPEIAGLFVTDKWQFVVGVYTGSALKIYLNGVEVNSVAASGSPTTFSDGQFAIGKGGFSVFIYENSDMDDCFIFNRALSAAEIWTLYKEPLAYYQLENVNDSSAYGHTLTNNNSVAFNAAKYNNGADGGAININKYLRVASALGYNGGAYSISLWVKLNTEIAVNTYTFCELVDGVSGSSLVIDYNYNGGTRQIEVFRLRAGISSGNVTANQALGTSVFHHIVITYDGTTITGYIDGASFGTPATNSGNGSGVTSGLTILDGRNAPSATTNASAIVDDVALFSRVLTAAEVALIYADPATIPDRNYVVRQAVKRAANY